MLAGMIFKCRDDIRLCFELESLSTETKVLSLELYRLLLDIILAVNRSITIM